MKLSVLCLPLVAALAACSTPAPSSTTAAQAVKLNFVAEVNGQAFGCGKSHTGVGTTRSTTTPSDFRFYVSELHLLAADGRAVPVQLEQDGVWQLENIALIDFEDGSGPCRNGTSGVNTAVRGQVPAGTYTGVRFTLGVPFGRNHGDPTVSPAPLNSTAMFWNWQGGYKFLKFDTASSGRPATLTPPDPRGGGSASGFSVHLGSTVCASASKTQAPAACQNPNRVVVEFKGFDPVKNTVVADVGRVLAGANVDTNAPQTSPGCMSFPKDADCQPVMGALGLAYDGVAAPGAQQLFTARRTFMKRFLSGVGSVVLAVGSWGLLGGSSVDVFRWDLPSWVPPPVVPADNPMSNAKVELGRHLFHDPRLSADGRMSCASCHHQDKAFTDGRAVSSGVTGELGARSAMGLANVAYLPTLTWANPQLTSLEVQALIPLFGEHPVEMGMAGREGELFQRLQANATYRRLFTRAFPAEARAGVESLYSLSTLTKALAAFQRTVLSFDSPYDQYRYGGKPDAISAAAKRGEELFFGERMECYHCHGGFNFNDNNLHTRLPFPERGFHNTGLYDVDGRGAYPANNPGIVEFTGEPADRGRFRTPGLRNVAVTAPYMHDGSIATLQEVIRDHYAAGGRAARVNGLASAARSELITGFEVSDQDVLDLVALLESLTDQKLLTRTDLGNPWKQAP